ARRRGESAPPGRGPPAPPLAVDPAGYVGVYEREGASIRVESRDGGIVATQTVTGLAATLTPEPLELPLHRVRADDDLFVTQPPLAPGVWLPVRFVALPDGSSVLH